MFVWIVLFSFISFLEAKDCERPGNCEPPNRQYSRVMPVPSRNQWTYSGGFCGALSVQSIALSYGVWISQGLVRKAAPNGGGHGNPQDGYEILHTNISPALDKLKITFSAWDWQNTPRPQANAYLSWLKKSLSSGFPVVWFVLCSGDDHDAYGLAVFDHIEPVFGIYSNHDLSDLTVYQDDVLVHGSDWDQNKYYRLYNSLVDSNSDGPVLTGNCSIAVPRVGGPNEAYPCVMDLVDFGWSITGLVDPLNRTIPTSLSVSGDDGSEPQKPTSLNGTVLVRNLKVGAQYTTFRWDGTENFPTNSMFENSHYSNMWKFVAQSSTYSFTDQKSIDSSTAVYYATIMVA